jgi:phage gp36-like protein
MPYAATTALLERFGADEIAQRADRGIPRLVSGPLLQALAAGGDVSAYTPAEQAAGAAALALVQRAQQDAYDTINGYLVGRYSIPLVNPPEVVALTECNLARYYLYDDGATDVVQKRFDAAMEFLRALRDGKVSIGPNAAAETPAAVGEVMVDAGQSVFTRESLKDY